MAPKPKEERTEEETCTATKKDGDSCKAYPLEGRDKCRVHAGISSDGSSHEKNQNAATHQLFSSHDGYYHDLDDSEQEWVFDFTNDLLDRHRKYNGSEPDMFDKEALKNIAIDFHRVAHANGYFREKGLVETRFVQGDDGPQPAGDRINEWAREIRQHNESVYNRMKKHGLLEDPDSAKAESLEDVGKALVDNLEANY